MSIEQQFNILDQVLNTAIEQLKGYGMPEQEAQIALLIRLSSGVSEEILEIANMLRDDAELNAAITGFSTQKAETV